MKLCEDIQNLIPLYIMGDLSKEEKSRVESHLESCDNCKEFSHDLGLISSAISADKVKVSPYYGSELVVKINDRFAKRKRIRKRLMWAVPAFSTIVLIFMVTFFSISNRNSLDNKFYGDLEDTDIYFDLTNSGYFCELTLIDDFTEIPDLDESTRDLRWDVAKLVLEDEHALPIDKYLLAIVNLDDDEFENLIQEIKNKVL